MIDLLYGAVAALVAAATGACVLRALGALPADARDRILWMTAAGLGVWGLVGLGIAALGILTGWTVAVFAASALAGGGVSAVRAAQAALRWPRRSLLVLAPALVLLVLAAGVLTPVVTGDQTKYQLAYPKLYAEAGGLVNTPWTFWGNQQFGQNFLFAVAYAARGEALALFLNALWLPLAGGALARLVDRHLWRGMGGAAAAIFMTLPVAWTLASKAGADLALVGLTILAAGAFLDWRRSESSGARWRCALAAGLAAGTKVMGLLAPALFGAALLLVAWRKRRSLVAVLRVAVAFGTLAGLLAAPPYLRNALETGNPLHPFAAGVFSTRQWSAEAGRYVEEYYRQYRGERAVRRGASAYAGADALRFPWDLTMTPESFERAARQSLDVGPFTLAFLPAALWLAWRLPAARWVLGLGAAYVAAVAVGAWAHPRYVLPGLALVFAAAAGGARALAGRMLPAVVAVTLLGNLLVTGRLVLPLLPDQLRVATGRLARDAYLERHSLRYRFWRRACPMIGSSGRVMVLEKIPHPYFIDCPFVLASYLEQAVIDYRQIDSPAALGDAARALGVTHVAVAGPDLARRADPYEAATTRLWAAWIAQLGTPRVQVETYALYALPADAGTAPR